jgi:phosphoglycolate phosphatase
MKNNFFCDFDGTLIDSSQRLYTLFCRLVPECQFSYEDYWKLKRKKMTQRALLTQYFNYSKEESDRVHTLWMRDVESPELLKLDQPLTGVDDSLEKLAQEYNLYLVTARQSPEAVMKQLTDFGWKSYFTDIFVTQQKVDKTTLITNHLQTKKADWIAGDTGEDILTGKNLGIKTIAVTSGTLNAEALKPYNPDLILDSICDVPRIREGDHQ